MNEQLSNCCEAPVHIHSSAESTSYHECMACWKVCDLFISNNGWIKCSSQLPPKGKYVLGIYNGDNWIDEDDPIKAYYVIVRLQRAKVEGNNRVPYEWRTFGPLSLFGQYIDYWRELPQPPEQE